MNRLVLLFTLIIISIIGCRKDYPVSSNGTPVFYFNGTVNNASANIQAGVNNYYMYSSFSQDINHVYNFFGELKPTNCNYCNNKIKFQINDYIVSSLGGATQINTSLIPGYYPIQSNDSIQPGTPTEYVVNFTSIPSLNGSVASYSWDFGDGKTDPTANPAHTYSHPGYYNVCLNIIYSNACTGSICSQVKVGVPDAACSITLADSLIGNTISLSSPGTGSPPYTYTVDYGDGNIMSGISGAGFTGTHTYANGGIYKVSLQLTDSSHCTSIVSKNVSTGGFIGGCLTNFDFSVQGPNANLFSLSNVIIKWTNNSGSVYASNATFQPNDSYFQIVSVENYLNNENNQTTKKLHVKLKCVLFNVTNSVSIPITGDAVIAVSYR